MKEKSYTNLYQAVFKYPLDRVRSVRLSAGIRTDKVIVRGDTVSIQVHLKAPDFNKQTFAINALEYVHDNAINKAMNIWNGLRYKIYADMNAQINKPSAGDVKPGRFMFQCWLRWPLLSSYLSQFHLGRSCGAGDFSWGNQKDIVLSRWCRWMDVSQIQQESKTTGSGLCISITGCEYARFPQNVANGNNAVVINSEFRFPVFATLINRPINNAFLRNFQIIQFFDLGRHGMEPIIILNALK